MGTGFLFRVMKIFWNHSSGDDFLLHMYIDRSLNVSYFEIGFYVAHVVTLIKTEQAECNFVTAPKVQRRS